MPKNRSKQIRWWPGCKINGVPSFKSPHSRRASLAVALLQEPELLILDEPTVGCVQYSTVQYNTVQYSTVQYTITLYRLGWTPCCGRRSGGT